MALKIEKVDSSAWTPRVGKKPKPISENLLAELRSAFHDGEHRAVVVLNTETDNVVKELVRASNKLNVTLRKQVTEVDNEYDRIVFKVTSKVYRPRKNKDA